MAVLPGSLDYLYYNGILPTIPYEAYEQTPITPSGMAQMSGMGTGYGINPANGYGTVATTPQMNATQYLQAAQKGLMYDTYTYPDTFVRRDNTNYKAGEGYSISKKAFYDGEGYGKDVDYEVMANGEDGKSIRKTITNTCSKAANSVMESPTWVKGILSGGLIVLTLCSLFKGKKVPPKPATKSGFWSKLNPVNWRK